MTEPTNPAQRHEFAARLKESQEQITGDFIDYIDAGAFTSAAHALDAARQRAADGPADSETLMQLAEASIAASRILEAAAKSLAAQAAATNQPVREAARRIKIGPSTLSKWMDGEESDVALPANTWWSTVRPAPEETPEGTDDNSDTAGAATPSGEPQSTPDEEHTEESPDAPTSTNPDQHNATTSSPGDTDPVIERPTQA